MKICFTQQKYILYIEMFSEGGLLVKEQHDNVCTEQRVWLVQG